MAPLKDIDQLLEQLTLAEKVKLLSGIGACSTADIERLQIPRLEVGHLQGRHDHYIIPLTQCQQPDIRWTAWLARRRWEALQPGKVFLLNLPPNSRARMRTNAQCYCHLQPPGYQLPSATAMGATFDKKLLHQLGELLGDEGLRKGVHLALAPTVCLQRSPLIGRGFEAYGDDPVLSGRLAAEFINGLQSRKVGACIKHYAAHDLSLIHI